MTGLVKQFTGTLALDHVDFDVRRGEVHALLGQNGAGKSTLIKVLAGVYKADAGAIVFDGRPAQLGADPLPIAFIHQDLGLVEWMTVAENVAIQTGYPRSWTGLVSWPRVKSAAARALAIMSSDLDPEAPVSSLPAAERSLVAIGRALAIKSDIIVLDEPTAALSRGRRRTPARDAAAPARQQHRRRLRHPSAGRGPAHRRSSHGSSRRATAGDGRGA